MSNENMPELSNEPKIYNYISCIFENRFYPFDDPRILENTEFRNSIYGGSTKYTYKTDLDLKAGQVITIDTSHGPSRVLVVNPSLLREEITFPFEKIKELPVSKS